MISRNKPDLSIFAPERYAKLRLPIEEASTWPADVYVSQEWYEREVETIFLKNWLVATREEEIPEPGDYIRLDALGEPLIIIRDENHTIHALSASCRHRGAELLHGTGNCKRIVCPYHAWAYSLSGKLLHANDMDEANNFKLMNYSLPAIRAETWGGFVFINFDQNAPPLLTSLLDLPKRFESYGLERMRVTKKWEYYFDANWKIWVENSREGYHVPHAHRNSLNTYYPGATVNRFEAHGVPGVYEINSSDNENGLYVPRNKTLPFIDGLSDKDQETTHFMIFYPSLLMNLPPDRITFHQYFPEGPHRTRLTTWCCFPESTIALANFERDAEERYYPSMSLFIQEDKEICETAQRGIGGQFTQPGRYCPRQERTVYQFANYVLDQVIGPVSNTET